MLRVNAVVSEKVCLSGAISLGSTRLKGMTMSYQAYLDAIEKRTGRTPEELVLEAADRGFTPQSKAGDFAVWLKDDYAVGRGHAMALFGVLKNGATISGKHVGSNTAHSDASTELRLDGIDRR